MSIEAVHWALDVPISGNAKVILIGLANHAHPDGTEAFPSLDTLAEYGYCDRSTVRRNLRKLESEGWIRKDGIGPRGQASWSLIYSRKAETPPQTGGCKMPSQEASGVASGVAVGVANGVAPVPPEPLTENRQPKRSTPCTPSTEKSDAFEYWRETCRKPRAKFTPERKRRVGARLKEGYSILDIRRGIDGAARNPPVDRDSGMVYDDLVSICRNGAQLERYMERAGTAPKLRVVGSHLPEGHRATVEHQEQVAAFIAARAADVDEDELAAFRAAMKGEPA